MFKRRMPVDYQDLDSPSFAGLGGKKRVTVTALAAHAGYEPNVVLLRTLESPESRCAMAQPSQTGRALLEGETVATEDDFQEARDDVTQTDVAAEEVRDHPDDPPVDPAYNFPMHPQSFAPDLTFGLTAETMQLLDPGGSDPTASSAEGRVAGQSVLQQRETLARAAESVVPGELPPPGLGLLSAGKRDREDMELVPDYASAEPALGGALGIHSFRDSAHTAAGNCSRTESDFGPLDGNGTAGFAIQCGTCVGTGFGWSGGCDVQA